MRTSGLEFRIWRVCSTYRSPVSWTCCPVLSWPVFAVSAGHSGAKSYGRGIRDFKHVIPTYLVSLESSGHPEIIFDDFEKYGH